MNVIWFVLDTLRAGHLGCYGYFRPTSPNIDRLPEEDVQVEGLSAPATATGRGCAALAAIYPGFPPSLEAANALPLDSRSSFYWSGCVPAVIGLRTTRRARPSIPARLLSLPGSSALAREEIVRPCPQLRPR